MTAERDAHLRAAMCARRRGDARTEVAELQLAVDASRGAMTSRVRRSVPTEAVEDVVDAAVVSAVESIARKPPRADSGMTFGAWVRTVVSREIANYWRARGSVATVEISEETGGHSALEPWEILHRREVLRRAFDAVPAGHRRRMHRYLILDLPADSVCGGSLSKCHVYKAGERYRRRLRELLEDA